MSEIKPFEIFEINVYFIVAFEAKIPPNPNKNKSSSSG